MTKMAGPGMAALLGQGVESVRELRAAMAGIDGLAKKTADDMESVIGGALRRFKAAISVLSKSFSATFSPAISLFLDTLISVVSYLARNLPGGVKIAVGTMARGLTLLAGWHLAIKKVFGASKLLYAHLLNVSPLFARTAAAIRVATVALAGFARKAAMFLLTNPVGLALTAVGAAATYMGSNIPKKR